MAFLSYAQFLKNRYGVPTYKLTLAGGRTCPTRDGSYGPKLGWGGCSFCDVYGSASYFSNANKAQPIAEQMESAAKAVREKHKAEKFIAYFQSYTTTHQEIAAFKSRYDEAVNFPGVVALAVGTRPDCLPEEVLDLLCSYLKSHDVILELGVQSFNDSVLNWFDRGHDVATAVDALERSLSRAREGEKDLGRAGAFHVCAHMIFGTPGETTEDLVYAAKKLNSLGVHGVKIHNLHVLKRTKLARRFSEEKFFLYGMEEFMERMAFFIRHLDPKIVIHRTHGVASHPEDLIAPDWSIMKARPAQYLRDLMIEKKWQQGDLLN